MKRPNTLRHIRITLATLVIISVSAAFLDYRDWLPAASKHTLTMIQFVPAALTVSAAALLILIVSALLGRVYCSVLCPLGILQDVISRLANLLRRKKLFLRHRQPDNKLRHAILAAVIISVALGWGGFTLAWLDPYSNFGRIAAELLRPPVIFTNNLLATLSKHLGSAAVPRVGIPWAGLAVFLPPLLIGALIVTMSAWRGRLYCNTLCPVGALLGLLAKFSLFKLAIDKSACKKCGDCLRSCKSQCINLKDGGIDFTRCVACYNCVSVCDEHGIKYRFQNPLNFFRAKKTAADTQPNADRRNFILATVTGSVAAGTGVNLSGGKFINAVLPPGAQSREQFLGKCTACQLCISACPSHVLEPSFLEYASLSGFMKPRLNLNKSFCNFNCTVCGEVCPDAAILPLAEEAKKTTRIGIAVFDHKECIIYRDGTACGACAEHCPTAALQIAKTNLFKDPLPVVSEQYCIGCGACQYACPALPKKAILISGLKKQETAGVLKQEKVKAADDEFPF
ncbi:MAG: 4Fe-4S dicluster domain-containing protein [Verrucomicrobiales bacterium]|jgi:polyferredoxin|nr:4Fe-4S dicluster domain-containing protein [Verrucomicrobiales bacterium]